MLDPTADHAEVVPGDSGGPLLNGAGSAIGMNTAGSTGYVSRSSTDSQAYAIPIVKALVERGAEVSAYDPVARQQAEQVLSGVEFADDAYAAADGADALVIVTEWDEFRALDLERVAASLRGKILVDLRNVYDRADAEAAGLTYYGIGRGRPVNP